MQNQSLILVTTRLQVFPRSSFLARYKAAFGPRLDWLRFAVIALTLRVLLSKTATRKPLQENHRLVITSSGLNLTQYGILRLVKRPMHSPGRQNS